MAHCDVAVEEADARQVQQRVRAEALAVGGGVGRAVGLVDVEDDARGVGSGLRRHHEILAGGAEPEHRDMTCDEGVGIGVAPELPAERCQCLLPRLRRALQLLMDAGVRGAGGAGLLLLQLALGEALGLIPDEGVAEDGTDPHQRRCACGIFGREDGARFEKACRAVSHHFEG